MECRSDSDGVKVYNPSTDTFHNVIGYEEGTTWSTGAVASRFEVVRLNNTGHLYRCRIYYSARNVQSGVSGKSKIWDFRPFEIVFDALWGEIARVGQCTAKLTLQNLRSFFMSSYFGNGCISVFPPLQPWSNHRPKSAVPFIYNQKKCSQDCEYCL